MAGVAVGNPAGGGVANFFTTDTNGYSTGQAGTSPANGSTSHAYYTRNLSTAGFNPRQPVQVDFEAGDTYAGTMSFGGASQQPFTIVGDALDLTLNAMISGSNVDTTSSSEWAIGSSNPSRVVMPTVGCILSIPFQSRVAASKGQLKYINYIIGAAQMRMSPAGTAFQAKNQTTINVSPTIVGKLPLGIAFGSNQNFQDNETDLVWIVSDNPLAMTTFISDASAVVFTLGYRPVSSTVTLGGAKHIFARNGTAVALSSLNTTTGVATMATAGTAGDRNIILYETTFQAI